MQGGDWKSVLSRASFKFMTTDFLPVQRDVVLVSSCLRFHMCSNVRLNLNHKLFNREDLLDTFYALCGIYEYGICTYKWYKNH